MQEQHGRAAAAVPHPQPDPVVALAPRQLETVEHTGLPGSVVEVRLPWSARSTR
ncbi:hypothetical protein OIE52_24790 [Streptomyces canus]|uniref:hypothetical protein n=1 Tax=Streptomyces canus TaxID=58343 RepID=UPI00324EB243